MVQWLEPAEHLGESDRAPWLGRLFYDDYDPAARALRGLNAALGRSAGRRDEPPHLSEEEFAQALRSDNPLHDRYFLEYPHTALWLFRTGFDWRAAQRLAPVPAAVADGDFHNLVEHEPQSADELRIWSALRGAIRVYSFEGLVCLLGLMALVGRLAAVPAKPTIILLPLVLPACLYFALHRFDVVPALLTALCFFCLKQRRWAGAACFLGLATMVKVYPVLLAPLVLRYVHAQTRQVFPWLASYGLVIALLTGVPLILWGWEATTAPYRFQLTRPLEGWTLYGFVLPPFLGERNLAGTIFRQGTLLAMIGVACWKAPRGFDSVLGRAAAILIGFIGLQVFYSPQWLIWLVPLLTPLASIDHSLRRLVIALDVITFLTFPIVFDLGPWAGEPLLRACLIYARFGIGLASLIRLVRAETAGQLGERPAPV